MSTGRRSTLDRSARAGRCRRSPRQPRPRFQRTSSRSPGSAHASCRNDCSYGGRWIPCSVMMPVTYAAGVTSNRGVPDRRAHRSEADATMCVTVAAGCAPRWDADRRACSGRRSTSGAATLERDPVLAGQHRERVTCRSCWRHRRWPAMRSAQPTTIDQPVSHHRAGHAVVITVVESRRAPVPTRSPPLQERPRFVASTSTCLLIDGAG